MIVANRREDRSWLKMSLCLGDNPATCPFSLSVQGGLVKRLPNSFFAFQGAHYVQSYLIHQSRSNLFVSPIASYQMGVILLSVICDTGTSILQSASPTPRLFHEAHPFASLITEKLKPSLSTSTTSTTTTPPPIHAVPGFFLQPHYSFINLGPFLHFHRL